VLPSEKGSRTVPDVRIDGTIDLSSMPPVEASEKPGSSPVDSHRKTVADLDVGGGTMEFEVGPAAGPTGGGTMEFEIGPAGAQASGGTFDFDLGLPPQARGGEAKPGTVHERAAFRTMEFEVGSAAPAATPGRATNIDDIAKTYDSDSFGSGLEGKLAEAWGTDLNKRVGGGVSLKGKAGSSSRTDQTLVVNQRAVVPVSKKDSLASRPADYELIHLLGEGGMGVVYSARQTSIDRTVAVKMLKSHAAKNREMQQKFLSEAVVTGDLDHPNIVPMYDLGKNENGDLFYAMKRVQGTPWSKEIAKKTQPENIEILLKIADAVAFAHARGVIHRDLKPENVMLGEFGEVLLMDWGLAYSTPSFRKSASITQTHSMGGSPAYMAPEMATGPIERINTSSDIYLLGAILYEILTGKAPHAGSNVSKCLIAAARNDIIPTEKTGDLVEVARRAMATEQKDRYATVRDLQAAIRECLAHAESISLAARADLELKSAAETADYRTFSRAVFGFEEALALWPGNEHAATRRFDARFQYASCAFGKGDYELAAGLLERSLPAHAELGAKVDAENQEREARRHRLRRAKQVLVAFVVLLFAGGTAAYYRISVERDKANIARAETVVQRDIAVEAKKKSEADRLLAVAAEAKTAIERDKAIAAEKKSEADRLLAVAAEAKTAIERDKAIAAEKKSEADRLRAVAAEAKTAIERDKATKAEVVAGQERDAAKRSAILATQAAEAEKKAAESEKQARKAEQYQAYRARIGLAAARIEENAFNGAVEILADSPPELRNWEWGRLEYLCGRASLSIDAGAPVECVAADAEWKRFASGGWNGTLRLWDAAHGGLLAELPYDGSFVKSVAFSRDGRYLAVGGTDKAAFVQVWDLTTKQKIATPTGHTDTVVAASFDARGTHLLTASTDGTTRLWNVADGKLLRTLRGHASAVTAAALSPDERSIVTTGQDGVAIVWPNDPTAYEDSAKLKPQNDEPMELRAFLGHKGPIRGLAFSPDGATIATCGDDRQVLLWKPADVRPYRLSEVFAETPPPQMMPRKFLGHRAAVASVAFSADGRRLVSGGFDNAVLVWSVESGVVEKTLRGHAGQVRSCAISADGKSVVSASYDGTLKVWNVDEYHENLAVRPSALAGHVGAVLAADFSPDETRIITAGIDRTAMIFDARSLAPQAKLAEGHEYLASSAVVTADGKTLVTAAVDGSVRVWDLALGTQRAEFTDTGRSAVVAVARDGRFVLSGEGLRGARLWDLATGKLIHRFPEHRGEVTAAAISPDGKLLFTGEASGRANVWNAETKELVWSELHHSRKLTAAAFTTDSARLLTASLDNTVGTWEARSGRELVQLVRKHPSGVTGLTIVDAARFATTCEDGRVRIWTAAEAKPATELALGSGKYSTVTASAGGELLAAIDQETSIVRLWDLRQGREVTAEGPRSDGDSAPWLAGEARGIVIWNVAFTPDAKSLVTIGGNEAQRWSIAERIESQTYRPHGAIAGVAFSPDGKFVATAGWDDVVKIWNVAEGRAVRKLAGRHKGGINSVVYDREGKYLLTAGDDKAAILWRADDGSFVRSFSGHADRVTHAAFSPDGTRIVTSSADKTARTWNVDDGRMLRELKAHEWAVLWAEFARDGSRLVTTAADDLAIIWDAETGALQRKLVGHTAAVNSAAFSPDGSRLVTGSRDSSIKLWDVTDGKELLTLKGHAQEVTSVRFSPSGRSILSSARDDRAIVWPTIEWRVTPEPAAR
jgi:WD40 repeat protein